MSALPRCVRVDDRNSDVPVTYSCDPLGRRITETPTGGTTKDLFYNTAGNVIEEQQAGVTTDQYVWGLGGQNSLVLRDDNSTSGSYGKSGSGLGERLFVQQDPSGSVTSLVDASGNVQQRFIYDPYGSVTVLTGGWIGTTDSYNWLYKFQGGRQDPTSGLVHFGTPGRDYSTTLGRWAQVDRSGYIAGANLYAADGSNPASYADPSGARPVIEAGSPGDGAVGGLFGVGDGAGVDFGDSSGAEFAGSPTPIAAALAAMLAADSQAMAYAQAQQSMFADGKLSGTTPLPNPPPFARPRPTQPGVVTPMDGDSEEPLAPKPQGEDQYEQLEGAKRASKKKRPSIQDEDDPWCGAKKRPKQNNIRSSGKSKQRGNQDLQDQGNQSLLQAVIASGEYAAAKATVDTYTGLVALKNGANSVASDIGAEAGHLWKVIRVHARWQAPYWPFPGSCPKRAHG